MKNWFLSLLVLIILILSELCLSVENTSVRSPIISGTVPPSSYSNRLIQTPNPIDTSSNMVITGNVTGGKHFRGLVPYGSPTNSQAPLVTSSLDSFLRYSAPVWLDGPANLYTSGQDSSISFSSASQAAIGRYRPFFSPSGTVATTRASQPDIPSQSTDLVESAALPWSRTPQEMEKLIYVELGGKLPSLGNLQHLRADTATAEKSQLPIQSSVPDLSRGRSEELKRGLSREIRDEGRGVKDEGISLPDTVSKYPESNIGVYPSDIKELDRLISEIESRYKTSKKTYQQSNVYEQIQQRLDDLVRPKPQNSKPKTQETQDLSADGELATQITNYQLPDISSEDKSNWYIQAAQLYLKQGRYYRAADSFTLASMYKPGDPLAYFGKSHALFAAGEYMTSALFLSRALQIMPERAPIKVDIVDIVGDESKLEGRINDIQQRLQISCAAELQFLLGYIYYQLGKFEAAKKAIDTAYEKLPDSKAVDAVKKAVDDAVSRR